MTKKLEEYSRGELIEEIKSLKRRKKFGLVWEDKKEDIVEKCKNEIPVLKEVPELTINEKPGESMNLIIEGDNFASLQVLNYTHHGKIDVIYIDPPYNTGNKDFIYNDSYVDSEDSFRHSKWLSFMERRLRLAKELLSDDGVIFISIDDNEQAYLKILCDSIFREINFVNNFCWVNNLKGRQISGMGAAGTHETILCYAKDIFNLESFTADSELLKKYMPSTYKGFNYEVKTDAKGKYIITNELYNSNSAFNEETRPNLVFNIWYREKDGDIQFEDPSDNEYVLIEPHKNSDGIHKWHAYRWSKKKIIAEKDDLEFVKCENSFKIFSKRRDFNKTLVKDVITDINTSNGSQDLKELKMDKLFSYPKPVRLIELLIDCIDNKNAMVLDFFAGSGTTGQAVLELNKQDGGNRKFILCTNNESNIARDVTYQRIKTVVTGIRPDGSKYSDGISANVRYFTTDFIEKGITGDVTRAKLFEKSDEMIQVRENTFEFVDKNDNYTFYKNNEKFVAIIKDPFNFGPIWYELEEKNTEELPVKLYVFSYSNYTFEDEIPNTDLKYEICAIPNSIMEVYRKISDKKEER